jgi:hypothetical protein
MQCAARVRLEAGSTALHAVWFGANANAPAPPPLPPPPPGGPPALCPSSAASHRCCRGCSPRSGAATRSRPSRVCAAPPPSRGSPCAGAAAGGRPPQARPAHPRRQTAQAAPAPGAGGGGPGRRLEGGPAVVGGAWAGHAGAGAGSFASFGSALALLAPRTACEDGARPAQPTGPGRPACLLRHRRVLSRVLQPLRVKPPQRLRRRRRRRRWPLCALPLLPPLLLPFLLLLPGAVGVRRQRAVGSFKVEARVRDLEPVKRKIWRQPQIFQADLCGRE